MRVQVLRTAILTIIVIATLKITIMVAALIIAVKAVMTVKLILTITVVTVAVTIIRVGAGVAAIPAVVGMIKNLTLRGNPSQSFFLSQFGKRKVGGKP